MNRNCDWNWATSRIDAPAQSNYSGEVACLSRRELRGGIETDIVIHVSLTNAGIALALLRLLRLSGAARGDEEAEANSGGGRLQHKMLNLALGASIYDVRTEGGEGG